MEKYIPTEIDAINGAIVDLIPYVKPWKTVLVKRGLATILYLFIALIVAGVVVLIGRI